MTINDKIKQILIDKNITPSYFADEIGVQRSSISHILSGRNRPSFDVIQKIIRRFPELGYDWLMEEQAPSASQSSTPKHSHVANRANPDERFQSTPSSMQQTGTRTQRKEVTERIPTTPDESTLISTEATTRKAERIIVFYSDGSFQEYIPSS